MQVVSYYKSNLEDWSSNFYSLFVVTSAPGMGVGAKFYTMCEIMGSSLLNKEMVQNFALTAKLVRNRTIVG